MTARRPYAKGPIPAHPKTLGERLRKIRLSWGWNQTDMAQALHTNQKTYSAWERNDAMPPQASLGAVCKFFRTPVEALRDGVDFAVPDIPSYMGKPSRVAEAALLVPPAKGRAKLVDQEAGSERDLTPNRLRAALEKALEQGRPIWLVIG